MSHPTAHLPSPLKVGEERSLPVIHAERYWNRTGLLVEPGTYAFEVKSLTDWRDLSIRVKSADGYSSAEAGWTKAGHAWLEKTRRMPEARWFALIGTIGESEAQHFLIGSQSTHTLRHHGELTCYANDVGLRFFFYQNNHGSLRLHVKRLSAS